MDPRSHPPNRLSWLWVAWSLVVAPVAAVAADRPPPSKWLEMLASAKAGEVVTLPAGDLQGPLVVPPGVTLAGVEGTRVVSAADAIVLGNGSILRDVTLEGEPALRIPSGATVRVERVVASGGRAAILVGAEADARLERVTASCRAVGATTGGEELSTAVAANGAAIVVVDSALGEGCHRAISASGGALTIERSTLVGAGSGVRALDLVLLLSSVNITVSDPVSGAAIYVARSRATLRGLVLVGGAHGVLARAGRLLVEGLEARGITNAAVSIVNGVADLRGLRLTGPFGFAGVSGSDAVGLELHDLVVARAGRSGVTVVRTPLVIDHARLSGLRHDGDGDMGHGVMALESSVRAIALEVDDAQGAAVWVQRGDATLDGLDVRNALAGWVQLGGTADLRTLTNDLSVGVGVVAANRSRVTVGSGRFAAVVGSSRCAGSDLTLDAAVVVASPTPNVVCGDADLSAGLQRVVRRPSPAPPATR